MQKRKSGEESRLQAGGTCSGNSYPTVSALIVQERIEIWWSKMTLIQQIFYRKWT
jgi:hypothetical protein